jgi:GTP-binding protein HflX
VVAIVGYTNAGKSTLLNTLSDADVYIADQLFATLDPTTRRVELPNGQVILFTDTVGFIQKLPTEIVAAFRATLEEITDADVLVHVIDITHINASAQAKSVQETLVEIGAGEIPMVTAFNKIDLLKDPETAINTLEGFSNTYPISAVTGQGIEKLLSAIESELFETYVEIDVNIPYQEGQLISLLHENGQVLETLNSETGTIIKGLVPRRHLYQFEPYLLAEVDDLQESE